MSVLRPVTPPTLIYFVDAGRFLREKDEVVMIMNQSTIDCYNRYAVRGDVATLTIIRRNGTKVRVKLDAEDVGRVRALGVWRWLTGNCGKDYCAHQLTRKKSVMLSRYLMGTPDHLYCRFVNGDTTDCRKSNLANVDYTEVHPNRTGFPYIYEYPPGDNLRNPFAAWVYDPARKRSKYIGAFPTGEAAQAGQRQYLADHPQCRLPIKEKYGKHGK